MSKNLKQISITVAAIFFSSLPLAASPLNIENSLYAVEYDTTAAEISITHKPSGKTFAKNAKFENAGGKAAIIPAKDKNFGEGRAIEIISPNGNKDRITLCPNLPFVLISGSLHNGTPEPVVHNKVRTFSAAVETGAALSEVKTLGTGGLLSPDKNPGSYAFLTIANPASRSGVVGGWITHERGSGVVFSPVKDGTVRMQAQIDYGKLRIKPGADADTETFAMGWFDDATASVLAQYKGDLYLDGLTKLDAEAVKALAKIEEGELSLNGLTSLTPEATKALAEFKGECLSLDGLNSLDASTAKALANCRADGLSLTGLTSLNAENATAIAEFKGRRMLLHGLTSLDAATAAVLAGFEGDELSHYELILYLDGLTTLDAETARRLRNSRVTNWTSPG